MAYERFSVVCRKSDPNNGTNSYTFIKPSEFANVKSRENIVQASLEQIYGPYEVDKEYWIHIYPK